MAKGIYAGVANVVKKMKKGTTGVNGVHVAKRAYVGINGAAVLAYQAGVSYKGVGTLLSFTQGGIVGASCGSFALFTYGPSVGAPVDAYNANLVRSSLAALPSGSYFSKGVTAGTTALFVSLSSGYTARTIGYNANGVQLTNLTPVSYMRSSPNSVGTGTIGGRAILHGGPNYNTSNFTTDSYSSELVYSFMDLPYGGSSSMGAVAGNYLVFKTANRYFHAFSSSFVHTLAADAFDNIMGPAAASSKTHAIFAGGQLNTDYVNTVITISSNLVRGTGLSLSEATKNAIGVCLEGFALIGYGETVINSTSTPSSTVTIFDDVLTRSTVSITSPRTMSAVALVGAYALFAGGMNGAYMNTVDIFEA